VARLLCIACEIILRQGVATCSGEAAECDDADGKVGTNAFTSCVCSRLAITTLRQGVATWKGEAAEAEVGEADAPDEASALMSRAGLPSAVLMPWASVVLKTREDPLPLDNPSGETSVHALASLSPSSVTTATVLLC
jgi:hypothetical protein